jgi:nucleoid DNA-binding protein
MPEEVRLPFLVSEVADEMDIQRKDIKEVIDLFFDIIAEELAEGNTVRVGSYLKFSFAVSPAVKKGTPVRNPFTGQSQPSNGRPAKFRVAVRPLSRIKTAVPDSNSKVGKELLRQREARRAKAKATS